MEGTKSNKCPQSQPRHRSAEFNQIPMIGVWNVPRSHGHNLPSSSSIACTYPGGHEGLVVVPVAVSFDVVPSDAHHERYGRRQVKGGRQEVVQDALEQSRRD